MSNSWYVSTMTETNIESLPDDIDDDAFERLGYEADPNPLEEADELAEDEYSAPLDEDYINIEEAATGEPYVEPEDGLQDPDASEDE